ncbi:S1 family peptidase [Micromonospora sp. WMMD708]|uniref:S1 family peptidase n=1 Tax=Micromonospora sp. WMMD708 TaxID=3403464 RepID=UPI003BF5A858
MKINLYRPIATGTAVLGLLASAVPASAAPLDQQPAPSEVTPSVVGGHDATEDYPGMATLQYNRNGVFGHLCGATLVDRRHVVTNAHCVTEPDSGTVDPTLLQVRIGSADRTSGGVLVGIERVLPHAEWDWGTGTDRVADVAVLRLNNRVNLKPFTIAPRVTGRGAVTRILGWGSTKASGEGPLPVTLQELDTTVTGKTACAAAGITAGEICIANVNGTDGACYGDSGSPALQRLTPRTWAVIGGASRETEPICGTGPTVYTSLPYYAGWIHRVIATGKVPPRTTPADTTHSATARSLRWTSAA